MNQRRYNAPSAGLRFQVSLGVLLEESFLGVFLLSDFSLKCLSDVIGLIKIWAAFLKCGPLLWYAGRLSSGETSAFWKYTCALEIHPRSGKTLALMSLLTAYLGRIVLELLYLSWLICRLFNIC